MTGITLFKFINSWLGWCPVTRHIMTRNNTLKSDVLTPNSPIVPRNPGKNEKGNWFEKIFTATSIIILFATLFYGGLFWWPFFVGVILVAGFVGLYFCTPKVF